jgi:signal transduction histidine kinase
MSALALRLDLIREHIDDEDVRATIDDLADSVSSALTRLRQLIFDLVPSALHDEGLAPALRLHLARLESDLGIECSLEDDLATEPEPDARGVIFRIALEAFANVVKHARATRVDVRLWTSEDGTGVRISDNGRGFIPPPDGRSPHGHIGLTSMRERAELVGGRFSLMSSPGSGTTVEFVVPDGPPFEDG